MPGTGKVQGLVTSATPSRSFFGFVSNTTPDPRQPLAQAFQRNPADSPSRVLSLQDAKLSSWAWHEIERCFGPHSANLMALPSNAQSREDGSVLPFFFPYPTPECSGVNVIAQSPLSQPVIFGKPYVFPPIGLISQVLHFLKEFSIFFTISVPDLQPRRPWWPQVKTQSSDSFLVAPKGSPGVVLPPGPGGFSASWPLPWEFWVFHQCWQSFNDYSSKLHVTICMMCMVF